MDKIYCYRNILRKTKMLKKKVFLDKFLTQKLLRNNPIMVIEKINQGIPYIWKEYYFAFKNQGVES